MGWNDHLESILTECQGCGEVSYWDYWDEVGLQRYGGDTAVGQMLGTNAKQPECPFCGSRAGIVVDEDDTIHDTDYYE